MGAVYGYGTFYDLTGVEHKVEIYDTQYGGSSVEFNLASGGYDLRYDGIQDEVMFTPRYKSSCSVYIAMDDAIDTQMKALYDDIINADENQYWVKIYRKVLGSFVLDWIGKIIPDTTQGNDEEQFVWEINATDGLQNLDDYEYEITGTAFDYITDIDCLIACLDKIGVDQFFGGSAKYISSSVNFYEIDQRTTRGTLFDTKVSQYLYLSDPETQSTLTCGELVDIILKNTVVLSDLRRGGGI